MLSYNKLKDRPRDFLAATGLTLDEFQQLLLAFQGAYEQRYPYELTRTGTPRQRRTGGGAKGVLQRFEDKLLFILVYQKTNPLQTMHALQFNMSQPQANYWLHQINYHPQSGWFEDAPLKGAAVMVCPHRGHCGRRPPQGAEGLPGPAP